VRKLALLFIKRGDNLARLVKCPYCEKQHNKEEAHEYKKKYYHVECFNRWRQDVDHRKELSAYICELYRIDAPTGMMLKQIKEFQEDYKYKLKGIELALRYFHETLGNNVQEGSGLGIVPYVYEDAKNHYVKQLKIADSLQNLEKNEEVTVYIDTKKDKRKSKKIDITAI
jgi:hypothetical protein